MWERHDTSRSKTFTRRAVILGGGKAALVTALVGRMYYLQIVESDQYRMLADENRINLRLLAPPRGRILDRFGVEVAANRQNYRVVLIREQTKDVEATLDALSAFVGISDEERARILHEARRKRAFVPIPVIDNLTWDEFAQVNIHSPDLPGILTDVGDTRDYPYATDLAHVVGYVAAVSERDLKESEPDPLLELPGFRIGKRGIENTMDRKLRGSAGSSRVEVNAYGRVIRELARNDGKPGDDIVLTIDVALQRFVMQRLADESAAAVVLDIHTGDVLAIGSTPSFDPNAFSMGLSGEEWRGLLRHPRRPLIDKTIAGQYPPGSTFKIAVALAALDAGVVSAAHQVYCPGFLQLGKARFHCWKKHGHGRLDMIWAIGRSCDVYFYDVAKRTGLDRIAAMARKLGLGERLGVGLKGEQPGLVPSKEWKLAVFGERWHQGETLITGIGQGYLLATPLQLAVMTARLANGGKAVVPRLMREEGAIDSGTAAEAVADTADAPASLGISPAALRVVRQGLNFVTNHQRGTAWMSRITDKEMAMAGKTGTAQVRRISKRERDSGVLKNEELPWEARDHALFVAYAPVSAPRYAVAVVIEHGGSGSRAAAPVARDILIETQRLDPVRSVGRGREAMAARPGRG